MEKYLRETPTMDFSHPVIKEIIESLELDGLTDREKVQKIFKYTRDSIKYSIKGISLNPDSFKASYTFQQEYSYCIPKAIALCTLGRAIHIPSRIRLVDFINHRLSPELKELWGTNVMASHSYTEMWLDGRWVKLTPALDAETCDRHHFVLPEFNGTDALLAPYDRDGNPHSEYINDHGAFDDLPLQKIMEIFKANYGSSTSKITSDITEKSIEAFQ